MLTIPQPIKNLCRRDGVRKNLRVTFTDGSRPDLTNDDIVVESFKFTESICSRERFKFGLAEASVVEFETVGVADMRGASIAVYCEIDTSSLSVSDLDIVAADPGDGVLVSAASSDLGFGYYRIPYGRFVIEECPRNHEAQQHRRVKAYTPAYYAVANPLERAKLECPIPMAGYTYRPQIAPLALAQLAYASDAPILAAGWTAHDAETTDGYGNIDGIKIKVTTTEGHTLELSWTYASYRAPNRAINADIMSMTCNLDDLKTLHDTIDDYLETLNIDYSTAIVADQVTVPIPDVATLRDLTSRQYQVYDGVEISAASATKQWYFDVLHPHIYVRRYQGGTPGQVYTVEYADTIDMTGGDGFFAYTPNGIFDADGNEINASYTPRIVVPGQYFYLTVKDLTAGTSLEKRFVFGYFFNQITSKYYTPPADFPLLDWRPTIEANGDERGVSNFVGTYSLSALITQYLELTASFSSPARDGDARLFHLSDANAVDMPRSAYSQFWLDEYAGDEVGKIRYMTTQTSESGEEADVIIDYAFGNGQAIYDMSDNTIFKAAGIDKDAAAAFLHDNFVPYIDGLRLNTIELDAVGLPYMEAGDCLHVVDETGQIVTVYNTRRELRGIQTLFDTIDAVGNSVGDGSQPTEIQTGYAVSSGEGGGDTPEPEPELPVVEDIQLIETVGTTTFTLAAGGSENVINAGHVTEPDLPDGYEELTHGARAIGDASVVSVQIGNYWVKNTSTATSRTLTAAAWRLIVKRRNVT